jgi:actin-like ATPase involved in cell morphogenesis
MAYYLGIDLGTTYTAAAAERDGVVEALTLGNRTASVPSVVFLRDDGEILVGEAATRRATSDPGRVAREFKRRVGDPTPIILGGTPYAAEMLMARLLRWSVDRVREQQGEPPRAIALTHPANWGPYKLDLFTQAVRQVDLDAALMLPEPVAAATFYASQRRLAPGSVVAVYDLGGGTFDAAMVRRNADGFEAIGSPEGIERLGGIDFDEAVYAHVRNAVGDGLDRLDPEEPAAQAAVARLRQECIDAKEALSSDTDVSIPVLLPGLQTEVRLTRSEFEAMIRPAVSETIVALRRAIRSAGVRSEDISAVLLVGGSSRIPLVAQMVGAELGRPIAIDAHPKDAIAFGASIAVAQRQGDATPESVKTVLTDTRPPPPTVSSDATRTRPAPPPPGAAQAAAAGMGAPAARPPAPRPSRPAPPPPRPPSGRPPSGPATSPSPAGRPAAPTGPPPGSRPTGPSGPSGPAGGASGERSVPTGYSGGSGGSGTAGAPAGPASGRPAAPGGPASGRPATPGSPSGSTTGGYRPPSSTPPGPGAPAPSSAGAAPGQPAPRPFAGTPRAGGVPSGGHSSGGYPAMPVVRSGPADNKVLWLVLGVVAAVAVIVILVVSLGGDDDPSETGSGDGGGEAGGYTAEVEQEFIAACVGEAGEAGRASCQCTYDELEANVPFERFAELNAEVVSLDEGDELPQELLDAVSACG